MTTYATEKVGTTKDYSIFKYFDRNRIISKSHVENLRKDMNEKGQLERVTVNEDGFVTDGQHRIAARMLDKKPVNFRIKKGASMTDVTVINNTGKRWNNKDWSRNYSHEEHKNNKPYLQYIEFKKTYGFPETVCTALLSEDLHDYGRKTFRAGTFKIVNYEKAKIHADQIGELVAIEPKLNVLKAALAFLNLKKLPNFKFNIFKSQLEKNKRRLTSCNNINDWVDIFIKDIYNHNLKPPHKRLVNRYI